MKGWQPVTLATLTIDTTFGKSVIVPMPHGCDVMILCTTGYGGRRPVRVLLPHQLYAHEVEALLAQDGVDGVECIPYRNDDIVSVRLDLRPPAERAAAIAAQ